MKELLVIFDLNGTLISRVKTSTEKRLVKENPFAPVHGFTCNKSHVYIRPHLDLLLSNIPSRISIGVWTSAQLKNALPIADTLFSKHLKLQFLLDRTKCKDAPIGIKTKTALKDLNVIFSTPSLSQQKWNATNTILIDDTVSKCRNQPLNLLIIPEFDVTRGNGTQDVELKRLLRWFELLESDFGDIRDVILNRPLSSVSIN